MNLSVFQNLRKDLIRISPFPYTEITNALPDDLYHELKETYPLEAITKGKDLEQNSRYQISSSEALATNDIPELWKEFIKYHSSEEFLDEVFYYFGDALESLYPSVFLKEGSNFVVTRNPDQDNDIMLDCLPGLNSPPKEKSTVRGPHLDKSSLIYDALFYFRDDEDDSIGGDFLIKESKSGYHRFHGKAEIDKRFLRTLETIKYQKNSLAFFINSPRSFHSVSERSITEHPRLLTAISARYKDPLFAIKKPNKLVRGWDRLRRNISL